MVFQVGFRKEWEPNMVEITRGFLSIHRDLLQSEQGGSRVKQIAEEQSSPEGGQCRESLADYCYSTH